LIGSWHKYFLFFYLFALPTAAQEPESQDARDIHIENAWVRAMPPGQSSTAAYLSVKNGGERALQITGASSEPYARVEMHASVEVDGMVTMRQLQQVAVASGQAIQFAPGGMHLMMLDLQKMPAPGEQVKLCLNFQSGASACAQAEVRRAAPSPDDKTLHNHH
jgi:copper(I)-binding protein